MFSKSAFAFSLVLLSLLVAGCVTGRVEEPIRVDDPPAKFSASAVERCVDADLLVGKRQLLGSAGEIMAENAVEVPGLDQSQVDRLMREFGVECTWYLRNGHEFIVGEKSPTIQERKWAFAEAYNRCLYRKLTAEAVAAAEAPGPEVVQIDFDLKSWPQVWTSLHDEFVEEVPGCLAWLTAPAEGLAPKFVFHAGKLQEAFRDLGFPEADVVVPLDDEARLQLLALLRDDTPVKNEAAKWADGECATLNEALPIFSVTLVFGKQKYRYTIDPVFGFVDVSIDGQPELYTTNLPLSEKFLELYLRQTGDEAVRTAITGVRRREFRAERKE